MLLLVLVGTGALRRWWRCRSRSRAYTAAPSLRLLLRTLRPLSPLLSRNVLVHHVLTVRHFNKAVNALTQARNTCRALTHTKKESKNRTEQHKQKRRRKKRNERNGGGTKAEYPLSLFLSRVSRSRSRSRSRSLSRAALWLLFFFSSSFPFLSFFPSFLSFFFCLIFVFEISEI